MKGRKLVTAHCGIAAGSSGRCDHVLGDVYASPFGPVVVGYDSSSNKRQRSIDRQVEAAFDRGERVFITTAALPEQTIQLLDARFHIRGKRFVHLSCARHGSVWCDLYTLRTEAAVAERTGKRRLARFSRRDPNRP